MRASFSVYGDNADELREKATTVAAKFFTHDFEIESIEVEAMMSIAGTVLYWEARVVAWDVAP